MSLTFIKKKKSFSLPAVQAPLFDTHAHIRSFTGNDSPWAGDVLVRACLAGVERMVTIFDPVGDICPAMPSVAGYAAWLDSTMNEVAQVAAVIAEQGANMLLDEDFSEEQLLHLANTVLDSNTSLSLPALQHIASGASILPQVQFMAGVHPYGADRYTNEVHAELTAMLEHSLCAGIGEFGLDYHMDYDDQIEPLSHDVQLDCFARQLELAITHNVPVELHVRNDVADEQRTAHKDALHVLDELGVPQAGCVLHCFGEDRAIMEQFLERGCHIAFGGAATFKRNAVVREAFAACPLDRLLFETDCPYMAPEPIRGLECEPAMIAQTADVLAYDRCDATGELPKEVLQSIWATSCALFG